MLIDMGEKFAVDQDEHGRWMVVDTGYGKRTPLPGPRYKTKEEAEARATRYNLIMAE